MFDWKDEFSVGIPLIDEQHKRLFLIGERLHNLVTEYNEGDDLYDDIIQLLNEMHSYTLFHFSEEEKLMGLSGYKGLSEHQDEHRKFVDYLENIDVEFLDDNQVDQMRDIVLFLAKWIFKHINNSDFKYSEIVKQSLKI